MGVYAIEASRIGRAGEAPSQRDGERFLDYQYSRAPWEPTPVTM